MILELWPITLQSLETVAMSVVGFGAFLFYTWKKIQEIRGRGGEKKPSPVSAHESLISAIQIEREAAVRQRDDARQIAEELRVINEDLRDKVRGLSDDIQALKSQLGLITELNRRLAQTLDIQRQ